MPRDNLNNKFCRTKSDKILPTYSSSYSGKLLLKNRVPVFAFSIQFLRISTTFFSFYLLTYVKSVIFAKIPSIFQTPKFFEVIFIWVDHFHSISEYHFASDTNIMVSSVCSYWKITNRSSM